MKLHKIFVLFSYSLSFLISMTFTATAALADFGPLMTPEELNDALEETQPLVLDIRSGTVEGGGKSVFEAGHIPGAVAAPYALFRGPQKNPGQLLSEEDLQALLRSLGVTFERPIVVVHQGKNESDFGSSARVYWTLKSSGLDKLAILNGGMNAWVDAGFALEEGPSIAHSPSDIDIAFSDQWLVTTDDVKEIVATKAVGYDLVDARTQNFWSGDKKHPAALKPGTISQSRYFTQTQWFTVGNESFIDVDNIDALMSQGNFRNERTLVSFCNTGHWAATNWFVLSELGGLENAKLYAASMVEYSRAGGKMANTPGLLRNLRNSLKGD